MVKMTRRVEWSVRERKCRARGERRQKRWQRAQEGKRKEEGRGRE